MRMVIALGGNAIQKADEKVKQALLDHTQQIFLESGKGFALVARQQKVMIEDQHEEIDLVFYHIFLKCFIIFLVKTRELKQEDTDQINRYIAYFKNQKIPTERDPVALVMCKCDNKIDVFYSAGKDRDDVFAKGSGGS